MRSFIRKTWALLILVVILSSLVIFYAVAFARDNNLGIDEKNLGEIASVSGSVGSKMAFDKSSMTAWTVSSRNSEAVAIFDDYTEINAVLLNEIGYNVNKFSIYYDDGNQWQLCYRQNEMGINKLATFYTVKAKGIKVVIDEFKNTVRVSDIKIYKLEERKRDTPLRVTSYITPPSLNNYDPNTGISNGVDERCFDVVTDVQFIAYGRFNADGTVFKEKDADNLSVLRQMIGDRNVRIHLTIFPPLQASMAKMLRENMDTAVESVIAMVNEANADGADFDWEYPANADEYKLYSDFLIKLKEKLSVTGKILSVALSPWGVQLTPEAIQAIDQLQIMAYDLFDRNGNNNSYSGSGESAIKYFLDRGFKPEQLNLGISYYGRPSDASGKWYNFNDPNFTPDEYIMYEKGVHFNTPTTVRDRTVLCILRGIGGVMTFAQDEDLPMDNPLSLTAQIGKARQAFCKVEKL